MGLLEVTGKQHDGKLPGHPEVVGIQTVAVVAVLCAKAGVHELKNVMRTSIFFMSCPLMANHEEVYSLSANGSAASRSHCCRCSCRISTRSIGNIVGIDVARND